MNETYLKSGGYLKSNWREIRDSIRGLFSDLSAEELDRTHGDFLRLAGVLQEKLGLDADEATSKLREIFGQHPSEDNDPQRILH